MNQSRLLCIHRLLAFLACLAFTSLDAQNANTPASKSQGKGYKTAQLLYLDVTTDNAGAVSRVEFINKVPDDIQAWIRSKTMGQHFGIPNHTYRRVVELRVPR